MWVFKGSRILAEIRDDAVSVGEEAGLSEVGTGRDPSLRSLVHERRDQGTRIKAHIRVPIQAEQSPEVMPRGRTCITHATSIAKDVRRSIVATTIDKAVQSVTLEGIRTSSSNIAIVCTTRPA